MFDLSISPLTRELLFFAQKGMPHGMAMISIMNHQRDCENRYPVPYVLRLCFDDATETSFWKNLITQEQADAVRDFVLSLPDSIELLIVHCHAGVSRSSAVAAAILESCGEDASWIWNDAAYQPNPLVYRMVRAAFDPNIGGLCPERD